MYIYRKNYSLLASILLVSLGNTVQADVLLIEDQGGFGNASQVLTTNGFSVTAINNEYASNRANLLNASFLSGFEFVVFGERGAGFGNFLPQPVANSLETYVQNGGHLLVTGYDTLGSPNDYILANLVRVTSASDLASGNATWNTANTNHPVLNGPFGDFRNLTFTAQGYDDDGFIADGSQGAVALATDGNSRHRLVFTDIPGLGGSVGYWNGGASRNYI